MVIRGCLIITQSPNDQKDKLMNIGNRIRNRRKELGISAEEMAAKTGISRSTMFRYEQGTIENIPARHLKTIATALGVTLDYLFGDSPNDQPFLPNDQSFCPTTKKERECMKQLKMVPKTWLVSYSAHLRHDGDEIESELIVRAALLTEALDEARRAMDKLYMDPEDGNPIYKDYVIWDIGIIDDNVWPELEEVDDQ